MPHERPKLFITEMNPYFADDVAEIEKLCFTENWSAQLLENEFSNPLSRYFVAMYEGKTVGYCGYMIPASEGEILRVAVLPQYRRRGFARMLVLHLIEDAKALGLLSLELEVRENNHAARKLYENLGFEAVGRRKNYYKNPTEDALLLHLSL